MNNPPRSSSASPPPRLWFIGVWCVVLIATVGGTAYVLVRFSRNLASVPAQWRDLPPGDIAVALLATLIFYLFDYLRLYTLLRVMSVRLPLLRGLETVVLSEFASVLTPTAELHMPASVYILARAGVPADKATAAISVKTMYGMLWVCALSLATVYVGGVDLPPSVARNLPWLTIPIVLIAATFISLTLFANHILRWSEARAQRRCGWRVFNLITAWLGRSAGAIAAIGKSGSPMHLAAHASNLGFILAYCFIGAWLSGAVGIRLCPLEATAIFSSSLMIDYLAPVPGSIGVNEFATAYMLDRQLSAESLVAAMSLRVLCKYAALLPGALIAINLLRREGARVFTK